MEVLIVEDEDQIARHIKKLVTEILPNNRVIISIRSDLKDAIEFVNQRKIDVLLLDLNLNGEDGFQILEYFAYRDMHTVVISAYANKAIQAFEYGVTDFVGKPFNKERLEKALLRILNAEKNIENTVRNLAVRKNGIFHIIEPKDIVFIKASGAYSEIFLANGKRELSEKTLEKLNIILPEIFERVHKSYIVKMSEVSDILIHPGTKYEIQLKNKVLIPIGRTRYKAIKDRWF